MTFKDDEDPFGARPVKAPARHEIGQSLDALSVDELEERIALLRAEIERLDQAMTVKKASRAAADSVFRL